MGSTAVGDGSGVGVICLTKQRFYDNLCHHGISDFLAYSDGGIS
jgi:hypothetical protein